MIKYDEIATLENKQQSTTIEKIVRLITQIPISNKSTMELRLYLSILNFTRVIMLHVLKKTRLQQELVAYTDIKALKQYDKKLLEYFLVICEDLGIVEQNEQQQFKIKSKYLEDIYYELDEIVESIHKGDQAYLAQINKIETKEFAFIYTLIYWSKEGTSKGAYVFKKGDKWKEAIENKIYDYEITLCDYIFELRLLNLKSKYKFSKSEDFYTKLGKMAFELYTGKHFRNIIDELNKNNNVKKVLDIGCGYGNYIEEISTLKGIEHIVGIERQQVVHEITNEKFKDYKHIDILNEDIFYTEKDIKVDVVLLNYILFYFKNEDKVQLFTHVKKFLNEDGYILVCQYYPNMSSLKKNLAVKKNDYTLTNKVGMHFAEKLLNAEVLLNETLADFSQAEEWPVFNEILEECGLEVKGIEKADKFYYSLFILIGRK